MSTLDKIKLPENLKKINKDTNFFEYIDNFAKTKHIASIPIKKGRDPSAEVTIAIPTCRRANLLKEAIDSALTQEGSIAFNILIVDNDPIRECSTELLLRDYSDSRISYYKNSENLGMAGNWNRCFELCSTKWVVLLHDDDMLENQFLKEIFNIVEKSTKKLSVVKPRLKRINEATNELISYSDDSFKPGAILKKVSLLGHVFSYGIAAPTCCLFDREDMISTGGFNSDYFPSQDYCFSAFISKTRNVVLLNKVLGVYRWGGNTSMQDDVLRGFLYVNYFFLRQILKEFYIPDFLINFYYVLKMRACEKKFINEILYEQLGLPKPSGIGATIYHALAFGRKWIG